MTSIQLIAQRMRAAVKKGAQARLELAALCDVAKQELTSYEKAELIRILRDTSEPTGGIVR
jgi:hypothetical protein